MMDWSQHIQVALLMRLGLKKGDEAAVIGVPDPVYGEAVVAFIVPMPSKSPDSDDLIEHVRHNTAPFKAPEKVIVTDSLPKSAVGKILKRELREIAAKETQAE